MDLTWILIIGLVVLCVAAGILLGRLLQKRGVSDNTVLIALFVVDIGLIAVAFTMEPPQRYFVAAAAALSLAFIMGKSLSATSGEHSANG